TLFAGGQRSSLGGPLFAWGEAGSGKRRVLPAADSTVMSLSPLPDGDLLIASAAPELRRLRPDGTAAWSLPSPNADFRLQHHTLSVSRDGTRIGFGFAVSGKQPATLDLTARILAIDPSDDAHLATPRQDGLPIENWINSTRPTIGARHLLLYSGEPSRSLAINSANDRFVLGGSWS